ARHAEAPLERRAAGLGGNSSSPATDASPPVQADQKGHNPALQVKTEIAQTTCLAQPQAPSSAYAASSAITGGCVQACSPTELGEQASHPHPMESEAIAQASPSEKPSLVQPPVDPLPLSEESP